MEAEVTRYGSHTESRMRENCTYGSMRGRAHPTGRSALLYTPWQQEKIAKVMDKLSMRILFGVCAAVVSAATATRVDAYTLADEQARATPDWFRKGVMYQIQPRAFTPEGTIKAAEAKLPELAALGVTVVYMCPVTAADNDMREDMWSPRQVKSGFGNPRNPYRTGDYFHVDQEYGTDEDMRSFVKSAHANGIKVLMDIVYLHCGPSARVVRDHPEYFSYDNQTPGVYLTAQKSAPIRTLSLPLPGYCPGKPRQRGRNHC